jgi:hypothetical protein
VLPATPADRDAAKAALALRQADYQESFKDWEYDAAEWERTGGMNGSPQANLTCSSLNALRIRLEPTIHLKTILRHEQSRKANS